jgi:hypothetical protein
MPRISRVGLPRGRLTVGEFAVNLPQSFHEVYLTRTVFSLVSNSGPSA